MTHKNKKEETKVVPDKNIKLKQEDLNTVLPCTEATEPELTIADYKRLNEYKDNALKVAEDTQTRLRDQINKQVDMYNKDMKYMAELQTNSMTYTKTKEDAFLKVLMGLIELIGIDRMPIKPTETEGDVKDGN